MVGSSMTSDKAKLPMPEFRVVASHLFFPWPSPLNVPFYRLWVDGWLLEKVVGLASRRPSPHSNSI